MAREVEWLSGDRRFPGELRLPDVAAIIKVESKAELKDRCRFETRYYITSAKLSAQAAAAPFAAIGASKTNSIGSSMSSSRTISPACARKRRQDNGRRPALRHQPHPPG